MLRTLTALSTVIALALGPANASDSTPAEIISVPSFMPNAYATCAIISAEQGWQSIDTRRFVSPVVRVIQPHHFVAMDMISLPAPTLWSVDGARYDSVGPDGHQGADAAALQPFDGYKYDKKFPFGALLTRADGVSIHHIRAKFETTAYPGASEQVEYRINDTGLGDNSGSMIVCIAEKDILFWN